MREAKIILPLITFFIILFGCINPINMNEKSNVNLSNTNEFDNNLLKALYNPNVRIALSSDGNDHDSDDWGATALSLGILARAKLQNKVVHYDYSNHIWGNKNQYFADQMTESALNGAKKFGFDTSKFFDDMKNLNGAINNLKTEINKSSINNRLIIICAGPMETVWRGLNAADPNKRQYVTCVSHSKWNDYNQAGPHGSHSWDDLGQLGAVLDHIPDQNPKYGKQPMNNWAWLKNYGPNYNWVYNRIDAVYTDGDASDAGMVFYMLTGKKTGNMNNLKTWFANQGGSSSSSSSSSITINPYQRIEAESYSAQNGIQKESCSEGGQNIGYINNGDWVRFDNAAFGSDQAASVEIRAFRFTLPL